MDSRNLPVAQAVSPSAPIAVDNIVLSPVTIDANLLNFQNKYEVNPKYMPSMSKLVAYDTILVCDDSGSMRELADPDTASLTTRWKELKRSVKIIIEAHATVGMTCDIYFINRGTCRGVHDFATVSAMFEDPPQGGTNLVKVLNQMAQDHINADMIRPLIVHILTDGHPTNYAGQEDIAGLTYWLTSRSFPNKTFYSIVLCTDDEEVEKAYRGLEWNPQYNKGVVGVDVTEDYRGETRDVKRARGRNYRFTFGDYIVKTVLGAIDPTVHMVDMPDNCCVVC